MAEEYGLLWARYSRALKEYRENKRMPRRHMTLTKTWWGPTGLGKSTAAHAAAEAIDPDYGVIMPPQKGKAMWFDGAEGCRAVVIDDYYGALPWNMMLQLVDMHKCIMPVKHGSTKWSPEWIFFTSNDDPSTWYPNNTWATLERRLSQGESEIINVVTQMDAPLTMVEIEAVVEELEPWEVPTPPDAQPWYTDAEMDALGLD